MYCEAEKVKGGINYGEGLYTYANAFSNSNPENITLHVPSGSVEAYRALEPWSKFKEIVGIPYDNITLKSIGKTWYCSKYDLDFTGLDDIKAYTATGYDSKSNTLWLSRVYDVPAGTGIMLKGSEGEHTVPHSTAHSYYTNMFKGDAHNSMSVSRTDGGYTNYYLNGSGQIVLFKTEPMTYPAGKCYLQIPTWLIENPAATRSVNYTFDDEDGTTGIESIRQSAGQPGVYYNLNGQRVDNPVKGVYIKDGKKVIVR